MANEQREAQRIDVKGKRDLEKLQKLVFQIDSIMHRSTCRNEEDACKLIKEGSLFGNCFWGSELLFKIFDRNELNDFGKVIFDYSIIMIKGEIKGEIEDFDVFSVSFSDATLYQTVFWALAILSVDKRNEEEKLSSICNLWVLAKSGKIAGAQHSNCETEDLADIVALVGAVMSGRRGKKIEFVGENIMYNFLGLKYVIDYYAS